MIPSSIYHTPEPSPTATRSSSPMDSSIATIRPTASPSGTPKPYTVTLSLSHAQAHNRTSPASQTSLASSPSRRDISTRINPSTTQPDPPLQKHQRKSPYPHRSPKSLPPTTTTKEKKRLGYLTLDVYSIYARDPESLLFTTPSVSSYKSRRGSDFERGYRARLFHPYLKGGVYGEREESERSHGSERGDGQNPWDKGKRAHGAIPKIDVRDFTNTEGIAPVVWKKSTSLDIPSTSAGYHLLTDEELMTCSTLRMMPSQYLTVKETLLGAVARGPFKKREAKRWFRIDVNKTAVLYDWFKTLGWIPGEEDWEKHRRRLLEGKDGAGGVELDEKQDDEDGGG